MCKFDFYPVWQRQCQFFVCTIFKMLQLNELQKLEHRKLEL
jgi:hypothetical protein